MHPREYFDDVLGVAIPGDHGRMKALAVFSREAPIAVVRAQPPVALDRHEPMLELIRAASTSSALASADANAGSRDTHVPGSPEIARTIGHVTIVGMVRPAATIQATDGDLAVVEPGEGSLRPTAATATIAGETPMEIPVRAATVAPTAIERAAGSPPSTRAKKPEAPARTRRAERQTGNRARRAAARPAALPAQPAAANDGGSGPVEWYQQPFTKQ